MSDPAPPPTGSVAEPGEASPAASVPFDARRAYLRTREGLVVAASWVASLGLGAVALYQLVDGQTRLGLTVLGGALLAAGVRGVLRATGSVVAAGHVIGALVTTILLGMAVATGGQATGALFATGLVPLLVTLAAGRRAGAGWTLAIALVLVALGFARRLGFEAPLTLEVAHLERGKFLTSTVFVVCVYLITLFHENLRLSAFRAVDEANRRAVASEEALRRLNERLERQAHIDPLTGTFNRRGLERELARLARDRRQHPHPASVVMLDCDDFKGINERFGHAVGDTALEHLGETARGAVRPMDLVARVGGDEFVLLLPESDVDEAAAIAERLRGALAGRPLVVNGGTVPLTVSLGVAPLPPTAVVTEELLEATRSALSSSKDGGKNRVVVLAAP